MYEFITIVKTMTINALTTFLCHAERLSGGAKQTFPCILKILLPYYQIVTNAI